MSPLFKLARFGNLPHRSSAPRKQKRAAALQGAELAKPSTPCLSCLELLLDVANHLLGRRWLTGGSRVASSPARAGAQRRRGCWSSLRGLEAGSKLACYSFCLTHSGQRCGETLAGWQERQAPRLRAKQRRGSWALTGASGPESSAGATQGPRARREAPAHLGPLQERSRRGLALLALAAAAAQRQDTRGLRPGSGSQSAPRQRSLQCAPVEGQAMIVAKRLLN